MTIAELLLRTAIIFILLLTLARILGKKLISQMTFFDFIAGITLGSMGANMTFSKDMTFWKTLMSPTLFCLLIIITGLISLWSLKGRKWVNSKPTLLIKNGIIQDTALKKTRLTYDNLLMLLRKNNVFYLDEVDLAYFETNGQLSVLKKSSMQNATKKDVKATSQSRGVPQNFIIDGNLVKETLAKMGKDEKWVETLLQSRGIDSIKEVTIAQADEQDQIFVDMKDK